MEKKPAEWAVEMFKHQPWEVIHYQCQYCATAIKPLPKAKRDEFFKQFETWVRDMLALIEQED